ncbi:MAG: gliding motility-associated C-terminal domain-containing protein [Prevotellaceae bacterium]|jgi:hypothetical protein|nr:gliding motility-associated C-terminal domain-containing protein [Prevotellaceae bacterium]
MVILKRLSKKSYAFTVCLFIIISATARQAELPVLSSPLIADPICSGTTFTYTATSVTPGVTFTWSRAAVPGIQEQGTGGVTETVVETLTNTTAIPVVVTYVFTITASDNTTNTQNVVLTVNPLPRLISKLLLASLCSEETFDYYEARSSVSGTDFTWKRTTPGAIPESNIVNSKDINETLINTTSDTLHLEYVFTLTANGCSNEQNVSTLLKPLPQLTSTLTPSPICSGTTFEYNPASTLNNTVYIIDRAEVPGIDPSGMYSLNGVIEDSMVNETFDPITVMYEIALIAAGCPNVQYMPLTVYGAFSGGTVGYDDTICYNTSPSPFIELAPSRGGHGTYTYQWQKSTNGTDWTDAGCTDVNYTSGILTASTYFRRITNSDCGAAYSNTILVTVIEMLQKTGEIASSSALPLNYNTGTELTVSATGGSTPYRYNWYKRTPAENTWTALVDDVNPLSTGSLVSDMWFKVEVRSVATSLQCNELVDSIFVDVSRIQLSLEITGVTSCSADDSITVRIGNSGISNATNVVVEFQSDASLPAFGSITLAQINANSDTLIKMQVPINTGNTVLSGRIKAEITGCDNVDINPLTVYGNWKSSGWAGDPSQADEDTAMLIIYPESVSLTSALYDTICSGTVFNYVPSSTATGITYQWDRAATAGIPASTGVGSISDVLYNLTSDHNPLAVTYTYSNADCPSSYIGTVTVLVIDSLFTGGISSSEILPLQGNTGTELTVSVAGGSAPYTYKWYKKTIVENTWTALSGDSNVLSTGNLMLSAWFKVEVLSPGTYPQCNEPVDSIFVEVNQEIQLSLEITGVTSCLTDDSITVRVSNSGISDATNVVVEFQSDASLPVFGSITLAQLNANSDTLIKMQIPLNTGNTVLSGKIKAEITGCDCIDINPLTVYGSWKSSGWAGYPSQADEDTAMLVIYPESVSLTSALYDTVCTGTAFNYVPSSTATGITYKWDRAATSGIPASTGIGSISDILYNLTSDNSPVAVTYTYSNADCPSSYIGTVTVLVIDSLFAGGISSSEALPLAGNTGTELTIINVNGSITPYLYTWYKRTDMQPEWMEVYVGTDNHTLSTGNLTKSAWYKVAVSSLNPLFACNAVIDSIFVEVRQIELSLNILEDSYAICNAANDKITVMISNSGSMDASNVAIEFNSEGTLPTLGTVNLPLVRSNSDTVLNLMFPSNPGSTVQSGLLKAEIVSCDVNDANLSTVYGSWKSSNWAGDPSQADEDMLDLKIYPVMKMTGKTQDTVCSGETFDYTPQANIEGALFSWTRYTSSGIGESFASGTGSISEQLTNMLQIPVWARYEYILMLPESEACSQPDTSIVEVLVNPVSTLILSHYPADGSIVPFGAPMKIITETVDVPAYVHTYKFKNEIQTVESEYGVSEYAIYEFDDKETNTVEVTVSNEYGCRSVGEETFKIRRNMPNIITPKETTNNRLLRGHYIEVFNRFGAEIYRGEDGWDGTYKGSLVASATYLYILHIEQPDGTKASVRKSVFVKY